MLCGQRCAARPRAFLQALEPSLHYLGVPWRQSFRALCCTLCKHTQPWDSEHLRSKTSMGPPSAATLPGSSLSQPLLAQRPHRSLTSQLPRSQGILISSQIIKRKEGRNVGKKAGREKEGLCPPHSHFSALCTDSVSQRPTEHHPKQQETLFRKLTYPFPREMSTGFSSSMSTRKALFMFW